MTDPRFTLKPGQIRIAANVDATIREALVPAWTTAATEAEHVAKTFVPVDTGRLRNSIRGRVRRRGKQVLDIELVATAPYADFVEYGTGRVGAATVDQPQTGGMGQPGGYVHGPSGGQPARPFLRPAAWHVIRTRLGRARRLP